MFSFNVFIFRFSSSDSQLTFSFSSLYYSYHDYNLYRIISSVLNFFSSTFVSFYLSLHLSFMFFGRISNLYSFALLLLCLIYLCHFVLYGFSYLSLCFGHFTIGYSTPNCFLAQGSFCNVLSDQLISFNNPRLCLSLFRSNLFYVLSRRLKVFPFDVCLLGFLVL